MHIYVYICIHVYVHIYMYSCVHMYASQSTHTGQLKLKQSRDEAAPSTSSRGQSHKHSPLRYNDPWYAYQCALIAHSFTPTPTWHTCTRTHMHSHAHLHALTRTRTRMHTQQAHTITRTLKHALKHTRKHTPTHIIHTWREGRGLGGGQRIKATFYKIILL